MKTCAKNSMTLIETIHSALARSGGLYRKRLRLLKQWAALAQLLLFAPLSATAATLTTIHAFNGVDGLFVHGLVLGNDGNFYGTTYQGGPAWPAVLGTVFRMAPDGTVTTLYSFSGPDGYWPGGRLIQGSDGNFYGTTPLGGPAFNGDSGGGGTIFKITPDGTLTTLVSFDGTTNGSPVLFLQASDSYIYGAVGGGNGGVG